MRASSFITTLPAPRHRRPSSWVTPPGSQTWSLDLVEATLVHALDLAHVRAVDTSILPALSQLLPTSFLAANPRRATIETSFSGLLKSDAKILAVP